MKKRIINETHLRTWTKAIAWRVIGIILLCFISYFITKNIKEITVITILFHSIRLILYYIHDRIWNRISWGVIKHPLANINLNRQLTEEDRKIIKVQLRNLGYVD